MFLIQWPKNLQLLYDNVIVLSLFLTVLKEEIKGESMYNLILQKKVDLVSSYTFKFDYLKLNQNPISHLIIKVLCITVIQLNNFSFFSDKVYFYIKIHILDSDLVWLVQLMFIKD